MLMLSEHDASFSVKLFTAQNDRKIIKEKERAAITDNYQKSKQILQGLIHDHKKYVKKKRISTSILLIW